MNSTWTQCLLRIIQCKHCFFYKKTTHGNCNLLRKPKTCGYFILLFYSNNCLINFLNCDLHKMKGLKKIPNCKQSVRLSAIQYKWDKENLCCSNLWKKRPNIFISFQRVLPGAFIIVFRAGFLHGAVPVLGRLRFLQMERAQLTVCSLQPSHLLVDGGLRVWLDTAARFALKVTETGGKQISEGNKKCFALSISCVKIRVCLSRQHF